MQTKGCRWRVSSSEQGRFDMITTIYNHFRLYMKPKKLITEEKMAEHLQGLHISPNFTSHCTGTLEDCSSDSLSMESESSSSSTDCPYTITSTQDLEQKLRNAQRITICEQIRKLQNEPVIPQVNCTSKDYFVKMEFLIV